MDSFYSIPLLILSAVVIAAIIAVWLRIKREEFAKCLAQRGVIMFGSCTCPRCAKQKALFDSAWPYVKYIEINSSCPSYDASWGQQWGLSGTVNLPAWKFPDGFRYQYQDHVPTLEELAVLSQQHGANCSYE